VQCVTSGATSSFTYGADGLRRSTTVQSGNNDPVTTHYLLDGQSVVQEMQDPDDDGSLYDTVGNTTTLETGAVTATYCLGLRGIEYREDSSGRKWYIYDGLGSVVAEVDSGQPNESVAVTRTPGTDVYGNPVTTETGSKHRFCGGLGHTTDSDTGLIYMRARYYDPAIGRFAGLADTRVVPTNPPSLQQPHPPQRPSDSDSLPRSPLSDSPLSTTC
jgi:RHS repeat-associated protein